MTKYKIVRVYVIEAESKALARKQFEVVSESGKEGKFLEYEGYPKEVEDNSGWLGALKKQLGGK